MLIFMILTLSSCAGCLLGWQLSPDPVEPDQRLYDRDSIVLNIVADKNLNLYEDMAHTLWVCVYQFDSRRVFDRLADQEEGLMQLLSCKLFDDSIVKAESITVYPGREETVTLDRAEDTEYIGIVAGYQLINRERMARLVRVPVFVKQTGLFRKKKQTRLGRTYVDIEFGPEQIEETAVYGEIENTGKVEAKRSR